MGALIETERNGGIGTEKSQADKICTSSPVVYQLVRVGVDGRLVPATDDELMEVEHLLEDDRAPEQKDPEIFPSDEWLLPKTSDLQGIEVDSQKLDARLEDERLQLKHDSVDHSPKEVFVVGKSHDHSNHSRSCDDDLQPEKTALEAFAGSTHLNGSSCTEAETVETVLEHPDDAVASGSSISKKCTRYGPDFSVLKGELCLDNLTSRELQEVFRATFGRRTSVKDKLWLKRRITMGLTNSCEVPTTSIVIRDNKVVQEKVEKEPCTTQQAMSEADSLPAEQIAGLVNDNFEDFLNIPTNELKDELVLSGKRIRKPLEEYDAKDENIQIELCPSKRTRKPTKRYIEELSDIETRECSGRSVYPVNDSGHYHTPPKPQMKPVHDIGSQDMTFVTRRDSIGGCGIQIPYVSRMRRGRPRKDLEALMNFRGMESYKTHAEPSEEDVDLDHEKMGDTSSDNNGDTVHVVKTRTSKVSVKRKHHRAWTLCEVLKLVEGVARYGAGRWSEIRRVAFSSYSYRTSVDLKDKWRNLIRASFAQYPSDKGARNFRRPTSVPLPSSILLRVRELAEMHSQAGIEFGPSKFSGHGGSIVQEKGSGFL